MSWDCSLYCHSSIKEEKVPRHPNTDQSIRPGTVLITMPSITEYEIVGYTENNEPIINSTEKCPCTKFMRGVLEYRSHVRRHIRKEVSGEKIWYWIPLGKCDNRNCGSMCRLLPDFMVPYKHYEAEAVSDVLDEVITEESPVDCPSIQTMRHWKAWLYFNKARIESLFRGKGYRENAFAGLRPMNRKMRRSSRLPDN